MDKQTAEIMKRMADALAGVLATSQCPHVQRYERGKLAEDVAAIQMDIEEVAHGQANNSRDFEAAD